MVTVSTLASPVFEGRRVGTPGGVRAAKYIARSFSAAGLRTVGGDGYLQRFAGGGANVVGVHPGTGPRGNEVVVVGAHFDHLGVRDRVLYPGANDNASGVAVLLAVARWWVQAAPTERRTLLFVAFDSEEAGLLGSRYFMANLPVRRADLAAAVILDMVGAPLHPGLGARLSVQGTETSAQLRAAMARAEVPEGLSVHPFGYHVLENLPFQPRHVWSDYGPFRDAGIPVAFLSTGNNVHYHQPTDTVEHLDPRLLQQVAHWLDRYLRELSTMNERLVFEAGHEELHEDLRQITALVRLTLEPSVGFQNPLVRVALLEEHLQALEAAEARVARGETLQREDIREIRRAALRVTCYAGGPLSDFAAMCNRF